MNIAQIEAQLQQLSPHFQPDTFIYDLLLAYGTPKSSIVPLQQGGLNLSKNEGEIAWKKKLFYKTVAPEQDVHEMIERLKADEHTAKYDPRFIVVTDFETLLALDRKNADTLDVPLRELAKYFDFFLPWAGMEKATHQADVKAAERMYRSRPFESDEERLEYLFKLYEQMIAKECLRPKAKPKLRKK